MAYEPERPIERLLRAAAKKRRDKAGAPLELHPATRRLLQDEVARKFAKPERETRSFSEVLGQLWPRFTWGLAIFAVLAVAVYLLLPVPGKGKSDALLARNEPTPEAMAAKQPLPPSPTATSTVPAPPVSVMKSKPSEAAFAAAAPPARQLEAKRQQLSKDGLAAQTDRETPVQPVPAAAPQPTDRNRAVEKEIAASGATIAQAPAEIASDAYQRRFRASAKPAPPTTALAESAPPPPVTIAPAPTSIVTAEQAPKLTGDNSGQAALALNARPALPLANSSLTATESLLKPTGQDRKAAGSGSVTQRFAQVAPGPQAKESLADKVTASPHVLVSFQVEQAGTELRIVDGDGSVYRGSVQIADTAQSQPSVKAETPAVSRASRTPGGMLEERAAVRLDSDQRASQTYFFRVTGTNRSLNQAVVFTGNLLAATNLASSQPFTNALSFGSGIGGGRTGSTQPDLLPLLKSRISGKVVVGNGKALEINALPVNP